ncbi:MAG: hypothetical protein M1825_004791 [Sarcosagium campestre]|nr:MAG: hypothetical protein M1825_004791 [Sarcosagium campestre]
MAPAPPLRRGGINGEVSLTQLKSCLVNLPAAVAAALLDSGTPAQDVIVELSYETQHAAGDAKPNRLRSAFVGWTGMPSKPKIASFIGREEASRTKAANSTYSQRDSVIVEIDSVFARHLGLEQGQKLGVSLHFDPPLAHTINIEPQTADDWEIIELHATFLELNLLSQVRALPNPAFIPTPERQIHVEHTLILHLSPTSTANIIVKALLPTPPSSSPYAKLSPDAEVIIAPKTRLRASRDSIKDARRITSNRRDSIGGLSSTGATRRNVRRDGDGNNGALFFRAVDRSIGKKWFENESSGKNIGLKVWIDGETISSKSLMGSSHVCVTLLKPVALQQQSNDLVDSDAPRIAETIVARLIKWDNAPDDLLAALSTSLCTSLGSPGLTGGLVKIEAAPPPISDMSNMKIVILPFDRGPGNTSKGLRIGKKPSSQADLLQHIKELHQNHDASNPGLLDGPITNGLALMRTDNHIIESWCGGILKFDLPKLESSPHSQSSCIWIDAGDVNATFESGPGIPPPSEKSAIDMTEDEFLTKAPAVLTGVQSIIQQLETHVLRSSSVLLTGSIGSGKSSIVSNLAHRLRHEHAWFVTYCSCRALVADEARISSIQSSLDRMFLSASWGSRLGGRSIIILDDLDHLCPSETELQVGGENARNRQISELVRVKARQYCSSRSATVLLASSQDKQALHGVITGGHVFRETIELKVPDKAGRCSILKNLLEISRPRGSKRLTAETEKTSESQSGASTRSFPSRAPSPSAKSVAKITTDPLLDVLDLAGKTDGYMPGDIVLLISRAKGEALIRTCKLHSTTNMFDICLGKDDFTRALKNFTAASLRTVTLQNSTTTFESIGGLKETRKILLETLQYPTTYAPIFARCPLRLRSGLLLYGYPGCGKTLLASAIAGECGLNFISVKGPEILNKYIGASEKSVRDLFERAVSAKPCVLFFDEFDSIAPKRGHDSTGVTDRVVNQMLTQMDGAEGLSGVYVLAATSRPDLIDPALLRPGRLDKSLLCDLPSYADRVDILNALHKKLRMTAEVSKTGIPEIARQTEGYSGADLQALVYNAQLEAIHDELEMQEQVGKGTVRGASHSNQERNVAPRGMLTFPYGTNSARDPTDRDREGAASETHLLAQRAAIVTKLEALDGMKRLQRKSESRALSASHSDGRQSESNDDEREVTIQWKHVKASLVSTRPSISIEERRRLGIIYREFVVGRNGEMPNGQGPTEVGGRSSLM